MMDIILNASDGHVLQCWKIYAKGNRKGGLVIVQEIFGVTDQLKQLGDHYASMGYDVAIPALFDRHQRGMVVPFDQAPKGRDLMLASRLDETMADIEAAVSHLSASDGRVAVMGFCWGGGLAIRTAQTISIAGAIAFYGTRLPEYLNLPLKAPVLGHFGIHDNHVPEEMLAKAMAYLPEMEVHKYDAGHAFANDARDEYVAAAAELAHQRNQEFLDRVLGGSG